AEVSRGVQASAGCGAANREFADTRQGCLHALDAELDLAGVTAKLLAQGDRNRVHQVGAAGLHNVPVLLGLVQEGSLKLLQGRNEVLDGGLGGGDVGGGREGVVGGLAHVDVVVRVNLDARLLSQGRDDLVGVHVRGGAGAGLEDVDRE